MVSTGNAASMGCNSSRGAGLHPAARRPLSGGMALVETLVALLIMTTGMLGLVSMQAQGIAGRVQDSRQLRALNLSNDLIANLQLLPPAERSAGPVAGACDSSALCTPRQFAGHAIARWQARVGRELPQGTGSYTLSADRESVSIELRWTGARGTRQLLMEAGL